MRSLVTRCALLLGLIALFGPASRAQDEVRFDPDVHLDEYTGARASVHAGLYDFDTYEGLRGSDLSSDQLARIRELWANDRSLALEKIAARRASGHPSRALGTPPARSEPRARSASKS